MSIWKEVNFETASADCDGERLLLGWREADFTTVFGYWDEELKKFCDEDEGNDYVFQPDFWMVVPPVPR